MCVWGCVWVRGMCVCVCGMCVWGVYGGPRGVASLNTCFLRCFSELDRPTDLSTESSLDIQ